MHDVTEVKPEPVNQLVHGKMNNCTDMVDVLIEFKDAMQTLADRTRLIKAEVAVTQLMGAHTFASDWVEGLSQIIDQECL